MPDVSARLELPYIMPSQAQKHVTHNEALLRLDTLVQLVLEETDANTPPALPLAGQVWAIGGAPSGDWAAQTGRLAQWMEPGWAFITPKEGWCGWDRANAVLKVFDGSSWVPSESIQNQPGIGINTTWDTSNRLAVSSDASLLSHEGSGHQLKLNKASDPYSATLLYQSNWTGHAEMGLAGNNDFSVKVSVDGTNWTEAMVFDATAATVSGAAIQDNATDIGTGKLARADYAYSPGNLIGAVSEVGGVPQGAVMERGNDSNGTYVRFADGTQICSQHFATGSDTHIWSYPAAFFDASGGNLALSAIPFGSSAITVTINGAPDELQAEFKLWDATGTAASAQLHVTAIGRWF